MHRLLLLLLCAAALPRTSSGTTAGRLEPPPARHLTVDPSAIEASSGMEVTLGPVAKDPANPLFGEDQPWDVAWWNTYPTVAYDATAKKWKLWYDSRQNCGCKRGLQNCSAAATSDPGMCPHLGYNVSGDVFDGGGPSKASAAVMYAESSDGLRWTKPPLGLVEFRGSTANGIVLSTPGTDPGAGVFLDAHETNASRAGSRCSACSRPLPTVFSSDTMGSVRSSLRTAFIGATSLLPSRWQSTPARR